MQKRLLLSGSELSSLSRLSPTFLPNHNPLWRIMSTSKMNPDNTARDERQTATFIFVFIGRKALSLSVSLFPSQSWPVRLLSLSLALAQLYVPFWTSFTGLYYSIKQWRAEVKQIITSGAWWSKRVDRMTIIIDPVDDLSLTAKRARTLLSFLLAGKARCYSSSFLCWPLPLILILLSVSA